MRKLGYIFLTMLATPLVGCLRQWEDPYFIVKPSGLNSVTIRQYDTSGRQPNVHLRIDGNGLVNVKDGTSALVGNPFANNTKNEHWGDIRESRFTLPEDDATMIFQSLVDSGIFVKRTKSLFSGDPATNETCFVFASAKIGTKSTDSPDPVTDPQLLDALKMTVKMFYHPRPAQKKPISTNSQSHSQSNERIP